MSKQVSKAPVQQVVTEQNGNPQQNNLFISVKTFDPQGRTVGERVVDMYHFGTRNWLQNHHWWAMHNGNCVETNVASAKEVDEYLASAKVALAAKFNGAPAEVAAVAA
jgi:hypothetical protein